MTDTGHRMTDTDTTRVLFMGGPYDRWKADLTKTPQRVQFGLGGDKGPPAFYERVDDPDTGEFLGGYAWVDARASATVWSAGGIGAYSLGKAGGPSDATKEA
jgi:hypothetical protein